MRLGFMRDSMNKCTLGRKKGLRDGENEILDWSNSHNVRWVRVENLRTAVEGKRERTQILCPHKMQSLWWLRQKCNKAVQGHAFYLENTWNARHSRQHWDENRERWGFQAYFPPHPITQMMSMQMCLMRCLFANVADCIAYRAHDAFAMHAMLKKTTWAAWLLPHWSASQILSLPLFSLRCFPSSSLHTQSFPLLTRV